MVNPAIGLVAGTYTVTVTDANSCTATATVEITQPSILSAGISAQTNILCNGGNNGSATASASGGAGGYSYKWSDNQVVNPAIGLVAGTYTVTVTDANSCTATATVEITQPSILSAGISAQTNILCNGGNNGSATASAAGGAGGYSYKWSDNQVVNPAIGLVAGTYTVTVTDANSCQATATVEITQPSLLTAGISAQTNVLCYGGNNGSATATRRRRRRIQLQMERQPVVNPAIGLVAGTYTVTVTDANSCTATATVEITQPSILSAGSAPKRTSCAMAAITAQPRRAQQAAPEDTVTNGVTTR